MSYQNPGFYQVQEQGLKQSQRLMMSPQMQQAIHLLQLPVLELAALVEQELVENPVLEPLEPEENFSAEESQQDSEPGEVECGDFSSMEHLDDGMRELFSESSNPYLKKSREDDKGSVIENTLVDKETLYSYVNQAISEIFVDETEREIAEVLAGSLDRRGFLSTSIEELALLHDLDPQLMEGVLDTIQTLEPIGIGARNEQECLLLQLRHQEKSDTVAYEVIASFYEDLLHNRLALIAQKLGKTAGEIEEVVKTEISCLDLHPGLSFASTSTNYIIPDVRLYHEGLELKVAIDEEQIPQFRINRSYQKMLESSEVNAETKEYILQKIAAGKWLLRNVSQRNRTIDRIAMVLIEKQKQFFESKDGALKPMTMKELSTELDLHESTIARAVANKYIDTPRGILALRSFFTNSYTTAEGEEISAETVKQALLAILDKENKCKPFSDDAISKMLQEQGISCARRTVAKYRKGLGVGNTTQRKSYRK